MGFFSDDSPQANQASQIDSNDSNQPTFTGEAVAGGAAFYAMKKYEEHVAANGQPSSHAEAKELIAGFAGVEADRLIQTKGMDAYDNFDADKTRQDAIDQAQGSTSSDNY